MQFKTYVISMVRNEADIIEAFLDHALLIFDKLMIVDVQSTDGTSEILASFAKLNPNIKIYTIKTQEKYQSAMMNKLAREAFNKGADWVFLLDADEFLNIDSRNSLHLSLRSISSTVFHLPWINLIPSKYGDFTFFDTKQNYFWSGRVSKYNKIALSAEFFARNQDFYIHEGNHEVSTSYGMLPEKVIYHLSILHLPIRSLDRLRYKILNAWQTLITKENRLPKEGDHVMMIKNMLDESEIDESQLNYLCAYYGDFEETIKSILPSKLSWPEIKIPHLIKKKHSIKNTHKKNLKNTQLSDKNSKWQKISFSKGDIAAACINYDSELKIIPHPTYGSGKLHTVGFEKLKKLNPLFPKHLDEALITKIIETSFLDIDEIPFSAWSELVPALFSLFVLLKPRRYVELGSHYGMSFFAACQVSEHLNLNTQCVAVDSWIGDEHASFHSDHVFQGFIETLKKKYPNQLYIKGFFIDARDSFEDGSVDLLHIDGYHTYEAVKEDFETWLPKMSSNGVIIFHDINVFQRNFGVWKFWKKLTKIYPSISLMHMHGLGILYVGSNDSIISKFFESCKSNGEYETVIQTYYQSLGRLAILKRNLENQYQNQNQNQNFASKNLFTKTKKYISYVRDFVIIKQSKLFDTDLYYKNYPDVKKSKINPILHYLRFGAQELRDPNSKFSTRAYLDHNNDVKFSGTNPFVHYLRYGKAEKRKCI